LIFDAIYDGWGIENTIRAISLGHLFGTDFARVPLKKDGLARIERRVRRDVGIIASHWAIHSVFVLHPVKKFENLCLDDFAN
jgi:hypothetical protein